MTITGRVKKNAGRGRRLGFPTANLDVAVPAEIQDGIYIGSSRFDGNELTSLIFIGAAKTFGEEDRQVEVYILDFEGDLYDKEMSVDLLEKIRDNQKFASEADLIKQMKADERVAREFFAKKQPQ